MRARIPIVLACAALFAVACQDTPTDPVEQPVATAPAFNFMNGPEEAGVVVRYEYGGGLFDIFAETPQGEPWIVVTGRGIDDTPTYCGGAGTTTPWDVQRVTSKQEQQVIENLMNKDAGVTVYLQSEWLDNYFSAPVGVSPVQYAFCNTTAIAGGTVFGKLNDTPGGEYWRFNGTVDWMGEAYHLQWRIKFVADEPMPVVNEKRIW